MLKRGGLKVRYKVLPQLQDRSRSPTQVHGVTRDLRLSLACFAEPGILCRAYGPRCAGGLNLGLPAVGPGYYVGGPLGLAVVLDPLQVQVFWTSPSSPFDRSGTDFRILIPDELTQRMSV